MLYGRVEDRVSEGPCPPDGPLQNLLERKSTSLGSRTPLSPPPPSLPRPTRLGHRGSLHRQRSGLLCFPCLLTKRS